jgi:hypothetical protein
MGTLAGSIMFLAAAVALAGGLIGEGLETTYHFDLSRIGMGAAAIIAFLGFCMVVAGFKDQSE